MKYAGGCFGCLAFIFFGMGIVLTFGASAIIQMLSSVDPDMATAFAGTIGILGWVNNGCCCLSGILAIILLAVGMSKKDEASE